MTDREYDLIFDIGMHDGQDTIYYLNCGARVVAVEADPDLCYRASQKFEKEIKEGRLTLLNIAITDGASEVSFYRSTQSAWSSIYHDNAARTSHLAEMILVAGKKLQDLISEYGLPYYCKIDIEGSDLIALKSLNTGTLPLFISAESESFPDRNNITEQQALQVLNQLMELGYKKFKLVDQYSLKVLDFEVRPFRKKSYWGTLGDRIKGKFRLSIKPAKTTTAIFQEGSSGAFADQLTGKWFDFGDAQKLLLMHRRDLYDNPFFQELQFWADWHATY